MICIIWFRNDCFLEIEKQEECLVQRVDNELARDPKVTNCRSNANMKQQRLNTSSYVIEQLHMGKAAAAIFPPTFLKRSTKLYYLTVPVLKLLVLRN